jgi:hypothetical protein
MEKILFEYYDVNDEYALESAWAEKEGNYYRLENILFYAPNYSLGDIVKAEDRNGELYVTKLFQESGHSTIRIIFFDKKLIKPTEEWVIKMGCSYEGSNIPTLISVDIPPNINYAPIRDFLKDGESDDKWSFEESCLAHRY